MIKNTNKPGTENSARENIDLFIQKKSEADNRLIDYQDNTPPHIILKTDDLITEKAKNQKNLNVVLSGFVEIKKIQICECQRKKSRRIIKIRS